MKLFKVITILIFMFVFTGCRAADRKYQLIFKPDMIIPIQIRTE